MTLNQENPIVSGHNYGVQIVGIGSAVPKTIITNDDLTALVDTSDEWIRTRTGISQRRILSGDESLPELAIEASQQALLSAGIAADTLDLIIVATGTSEERYPATAARVQAAIGATRAFGFDLSLACTGFVAAVVTGEQFIRSGSVKRVLIVGADAHSRIMDWSDRNTCVLFGDGAGACILQQCDTEDDSLLSFDAHLDGSKGDELHADVTLGHCPLVAPPSVRNPFVQMNGREVFKFAVNTVPKSMLVALEKAGLTTVDLDWLVLHQANDRIIQAVGEKLGLPSEKLLVNLTHYGNTSAASIPLALNDAVLDGRIQPGQTLLLCGFGGGLSWYSQVVRWTHVDCRLPLPIDAVTATPEPAVTGANT
jgi:3-oxoacyl-[acyl-carrier-protein] synthase III